MKITISGDQNTVMLDEVKYTAVVSTELACINCAFNPTPEDSLCDCACPKAPCMPHLRDDNRDIIFV